MEGWLISLLMLVAMCEGRTAFTHSEVIEVSFQITEESWGQILESPLTYLNQNFVANVTYHKDYRKNINIRLEGRQANEYCVEHNSTKFSWTIDTGHSNNKDITIQGSEIIYLHNCYNDPSYMRQTIASYILDDASRTPRTAFIHLTLIIGDYKMSQGLYVAVEKVDSHFSEHQYPYSFGDLFEVNYPSGKLGFYGPQISDYPNLTLIESPIWDAGLCYVRFVDKIRNVPLSEEIVEDIANIDKIMFHIAVCSMIGNYNSASGIGDYFYMYFEAFNARDYGKAQIISSKFDETFGIPTCSGSLNTKDIVNSDIINPQCPGTNRSELPLLYNLLDHYKYRMVYYEKLRTIIDWTFTESFIKGSIEYNRYVIEDYINNTANFYSYEEFLCSVEDKSRYCTNDSQISILDFTRQRVASVERQLAEHNNTRVELPTENNSAYDPNFVNLTWILALLLLAIL